MINLKVAARIRVVSELLDAGMKLPTGFEATDIPMPLEVDDNISPLDLVSRDFEFVNQGSGTDYPLLDGYYNLIFELLKT